MGSHNQNTAQLPFKATPGLVSRLPQNASVARQAAATSVAPDGNHGDNTISTTRTAPTDRYRLSVDLSPMISTHLDHIASVTGQTKSAIISNALLDSLPALIARADGLRSRHQQLASGKR